MLDISSIESRINDVLLRVCRHSVTDPSTDLIKSGLCDSLKFMSILIELEAEFEVDLFVEGFDATEYLTVQGMHNQICMKLNT